MELTYFGPKLPSLRFWKLNKGCQLIVIPITAITAHISQGNMVERLHGSECFYIKRSGYEKQRYEI